MNRHRLKTYSQYFKQVLSGIKTAEIRLNDRDFQPGDTMILAEVYAENETDVRFKFADTIFTGREIYTVVTEVTRFPAGLREKYVMLSFKILSYQETK